MSRATNVAISKYRNHKVIKANELIQQRTHMLSVQEQKIILFLISQLTPEQKEFEYQTFDIIDFCDICGIDNSSGGNYEYLRKAIQNLSDKSMWVIGQQKDTLMRWISNAQIEKGTGKIQLRFDEEMKPFLLDLKDRYTQFDLIYTLTMRSKYGVRLYEILKSYEKLNEPVSFSIERFQVMIGSTYTRWQDIKRRIIEPAVAELNEVSDLQVSFSYKKKGRSVVEVIFHIVTKRNFSEWAETHRKIQERFDKVKAEQVGPIPGQLSLEGSEVE